MAKKSQTTGKSLVIVESPAKARTINRYLGSGYEVIASMGHVRDLPESDFGIDVDAKFAPVYEILPAKKKVVSQLRKAASSAPQVYLATDLDREGEAIAWHLVHALGLDTDTTERVVFNEITKSAIHDAFRHPRHVNMDKVFAQQARRILDRIVGYQLSPLLQSKIARGLSAGRVQSVAVRLIVEREQQIREFVPQESWRIGGCFATGAADVRALAEHWSKLQASGKDGGSPTVKQRNEWLTKHACLYAELIRVAGREFKVHESEDCVAIAEALGFSMTEIEETEWPEYAEHGLKRVSLIGQADLGGGPTYKIKDIQKKRTPSKPSAPFTTATLQQGASSALGFAPSRTMRVAQQLYEGVDLGGSDGQTALITYMRTDSTNLSNDSIESMRALIAKEFGERYVPNQPNRYAKAARAQEAHEAIRPTDVARHPETLKGRISNEQFRLYDLIWRRAVACQMTPAQWDNTTILIAADTTLGEAEFKATGRQLAFDGYLRVLPKTSSDDVVLTDVQPGEEVATVSLDPQQQYTSPPSRYSEAALVKKLESEGIGRPSTYAAIIQTIQDRDYVELLDKKLKPTPRGELVTEKLVAHFPRIMDVKFTSHMEEDLDKVEDAVMDWVDVLQEFYEPFKSALDRAQIEMERPKDEPSDYVCPECGKTMMYKFGKNGRFLACSGYPDCKTTRNIDDEGRLIAQVSGKAQCPECGRDTVLRRSRLGPFLGCTGYPECSGTLPSDDEGNPLKKVQPEDIDEKCAECGSKMSVKFSRGRSFLGCSAYPKCRATQPIPPGVYVEKPKPKEAGARCDKCGRSMVIRTGRRGPFLSCSGFPRCRNAMPMDKVDHLKALEAEGKIPDAPPEPANGATGNGRSAKNLPRDAKGKVDIAALGPPPPGFAWTRTGRPVVEVLPEDSLDCPNCGSEVVMKNGRFGPYFACTGFPKCKFSANLRGEAKKRAEAENPSPAKPKPIPTDIACEECGERMVIRTGRTGPFLGCSKYPKCKATQPIPEGMSVEAAVANP